MHLHYPSQYPKHRIFPVFFPSCQGALSRAATEADGLSIIELRRWATFFIYRKGRQHSLSTHMCHTYIKFTVSPSDNSLLFISPYPGSTGHIPFPPISFLPPFNPTMLQISVKSRCFTCKNKTRIQYKDMDEFVKFILLAAESSFNGCPNEILLYHLGNSMICYNISDFLLIY